ncbi:MAG: FAD-binding protein [Candidatus Limiplasma sp.]|nr:FAD-binding protein [Candidatus Limiplasma sp.]
MRILICLKQVPDTTEVKLTGDLTLEREFVAQVLNPADESALELGLELKEKHGGTVTVLTMGPKRAEGMLREALSRGADEAVLMTSPRFAGADTLVTAHCLAEAEKALGGFDLILCGRRAVDGETGQVGPMVAALLERPCVVNATEGEIAEGCLRALQLTEAGSQEWKAPLPAVMTLCEWSHALRLPTISGLRRAAQADVQFCEPEDLGIDPATCGLKASPTRVTHISARPVGVRPCVKTSFAEVMKALEAKGLALGAAGQEEAPRPDVSADKDEQSAAITIAVLCEGDGNAAAELLGKARQLTPSGRVLALSETKEPPLSAFASFGADEAAALGRLTDDCAQADRIADALRQLQPDAVLFPATIRGRFLSAWAAAKLHTGLTADCTALSLTETGLLKQVRPAFGGNLTAEILCKTARPQMASVRPGVFPEPAPLTGRTCALRPLKLAASPERMERLSFTPAESGVSLQGAPVIVTGGKGVGSKKGFEKLEELAALLGGGVGATRSAVDAGWISYPHQIGQTGITVRPRLYLAFGVSGLVQHTVGMSSSGVVVAVNKDRNAPIFACADYGIVADWEETIGEWIQYVKERKQQS